MWAAQLRSKNIRCSMGWCDITALKSIMIAQHNQTHFNEKSYWRLWKVCRQQHKVLTATSYCRYVWYKDKALRTFPPLLFPDVELGVWLWVLWLLTVADFSLWVLAPRPACCLAVLHGVPSESWSKHETTDIEANLSNECDARQL